MAYYAELDINNTVINIRTGASENILDMEQIYLERFQNVHKRTSYNTRAGIHYDPNTNLPSQDQSKAFRKNFAALGYFYDTDKDAFIPQQPYESWILNPEKCVWEPPVPYPNDSNIYNWNEVTQTWE